MLPLMTLIYRVYSCQCIDHEQVCILEFYKLLIPKKAVEDVHNPPHCTYSMRYMPFPVDYTNKYIFTYIQYKNAYVYAKINNTIKRNSSHCTYIHAKTRWRISTLCAV